MKHTVFALLLTILALTACGTTATAPATPVKWPTPPPVQPLPTPQRPSATYWQLSTTYAGEKLFGLQYVRGVVNSAYWFESGLIQSVPTADVDYLLNYGSQELVKLPGYRTDYYRYLGPIYVAGSGWVSAWQAPNGGRFAYLHMSNLWTSTFGAPRIMHPPLGASKDTDVTDGRNKGDENVIRAIGGFDRKPTATGYYSGGTVIGHTGYPTDPAYGNGVAGPINAQLCIVLDAVAAQWFYNIVVGYHRPPAPRPKPPKKHRKPFPARKWNRYHRTHRLRLVPYKKHGHLTWPASIFKWHVKGLHSFIRATWNGKVNSYRFVGGVAYANPKRRTVWIKWRKPPRRSGVGWKPIPVVGIHGRHK